MRVSCEPIYKRGEPTVRMIPRIEALRLSNIATKKAMERLAKAIANVDVQVKAQLKVSERT